MCDIHDVCEIYIICTRICTYDIQVCYTYDMLYMVYMCVYVCLDMIQRKDWLSAVMNMPWAEGGQWHLLQHDGLFLHGNKSGETLTDYTKPLHMG